MIPPFPPLTVIKVYSAILNQTGTSDPTATVLHNTLDGQIVWTRSTTGQYIGTLTGAFKTLKTLVLTEPQSATRLTWGARSNDNEILLHQKGTTFTYMDNLSNVCIEIRTYQ